MVDLCGNCEEFARKIAELEDDLNSVSEEAEFMKTLWKQVQHENPDVGELVSVIFQKFTKQCEEKDNNILEILKEKDLEVTKMKQEILWLEGRLQQEKSEKDQQQRDWDEKQDDLNELISTLEEQLAVKSLEVLEDPDKKKHKVLVGQLDEQKNSLEVQIVDMRNDLKNCVKEMKVLKKKHERKEEENINLQVSLRSREEELVAHKLIISELKDSLSDKKEDISLLKEKLSIAEHDATGALAALEKSEERLREAEREFIESERKQKENDENYQYSLEKLNKTVSNLEQKIESVIQENRLLSKENDRIKSGECEPCNKKNGQIEALQKRGKDLERYKELLLSVKDKCVRYLDRQLAYQDIPDVVDIILADITGNSEDLQRSTKLIKQLQGNCQEKDSAFDKLKEMHDNRLERMGTLQEYLHEVLEEIKMLDRNRWTELYSNLNEFTENAPIPMRHEDSSSVWNNLQYYKNLASKLSRKVHEVEEEFDKVRLQRVMDANAFNDMKAAILADKQACEQKLRIANHQSICGCNLQVEILKDKIENLSDKNNELNSENVQLISKLKKFQKAADSMRKKQTEHETRYTQTSKAERQSFGTVTDNIVGFKEKENNNFMNSLNLLDKLARENEQKDDSVRKPLKKLKTPLKSKTPMKPSQIRSMLKTIATQTISKPPIKVLQKPPAAMKIRLASLSQQVAVLTKSKHKHERLLLEEKSKTETVEKQLGTALRQVASAQNLIVGLNEDIRVANEEIRHLKDEISELQNSGLRQSELAQLTERSSELKKLNHQNSLLNSQISNLSSAVRNLQQEVDDKKVHIKLLEDKIYKAEKTARQNRTDTDAVRKDAANYKSEIGDLTEKLNEAIKKSKRIQDVADNRKNYIETLKSQLTHAKANLEQANNRSEELKETMDKQSKNLHEFRRKHVDSDKVMGDIQRLATKQLKEQEKKFHEIEDVFNNEISHLNKRNLQWEKCIRSVIRNIVTRIKEEKARKDATSSLSSVEYEKAKQISSSILNLSEADFHDIMSSTKMGASSLDDTDTHVWKGQLAKILALEEFGPVLTRSIMQLFDEFARVLSGADASSIVTGNSLTHSEN